MHLIIDGYEGEAAKLWDRPALQSFLETLPDQMQMKRITDPYIISYSGEKPEDAGISGFVIIAESHIAIHTFPQRRFCNVDIFSCKEFDAEQAITAVRDLYGLGRVEVKTLPRGLEWLNQAQGRTETDKQRRVL